MPNRRSIWARSDKTPFGHGSPYNRRQLETLLRDAMFSTMGWQYALHAPPLEHNLVLRSITGLERLGGSLWPGIGGVIMVEGKKELLAPTGRLKSVPALGRLVTFPAPQKFRDRSDNVRCTTGFASVDLKTAAFRVSHFGQPGSPEEVLVCGVPD